MIRAALLLGMLGFFLWAPWMDKRTPEAMTQVILDAFGPVPAACYDSEGNELLNGIEARWYPFGRLVHTCAGDYVLWLWGDVKELGGVVKRSEDIQPSVSKPLTCTDVVARQDTRRDAYASSTLKMYSGTSATEPDFSLLPEARTHAEAIKNALKGGATFAGSFTVASWNCGANCKEHAIVHVGSGLVVATGIQTEYGIRYTLDSSILITNPKENLPPLPTNEYETENAAFAIARVPREYYRLTADALSKTEYLVRVCIESAATGYIEVADERIGVVGNTIQHTP